LRKADKSDMDVRAYHVPFGTLPVIAMVIMACQGCAFGPRVLHHTRLPYNAALKDTTEEQLLLNIVRLRYLDNYASVAITNIADQKELAAGAQLIPFFTPGGPGEFKFVGLPQLQASGASRPTLSFAALDDQEFTRRLFTPAGLDVVAPLIQSTCPISTQFRLQLDSLNRVPNARLASGPTPKEPPVFAQFLTGIQALQRLEDRHLVMPITEDRDEKVTDAVAAENSTAAALEAAKSGLEYRKDEKGQWTLVRKRTVYCLRFGDVDDDADFLIFCQAFHLDPKLRKLDLTAGALDPFLARMPKEGLGILDLDIRSLLQMYFFVAHGVHVPPEHVMAGIVPMTVGHDGMSFDWDAVLQGLFRVCWAKGNKPPCHAHVAVCYKGYWFYIDDRDQETKTTFTFLLELSRLELGTKKAPGPTFTLPLNQ
jgi:hypothetical protein